MTPGFAVGRGFGLDGAGPWGAASLIDFPAGVLVGVAVGFGWCGVPGAACESVNAAIVKAKSETMRILP
ncbi:hypothetical protein RZN05_18660 [Sphingomonas sp. HF-S4]|uniref:Uncharacterized protein n=1 Tax=Sphingomonas agrestis TaxID=3080540 RepID=A0ABU3YD08_9SPHN|nr:hypothetical protein [Sphingomonas sp. HF-S4]MDV3459027.1 hypothetical protein [Sphingomonas sp. HF-S4]